MPGLQHLVKLANFRHWKSSKTCTSNGFAPSAKEQKDFFRNLIERCEQNSSAIKLHSVVGSSATVFKNSDATPDLRQQCIVFSSGRRRADRDSNGNCALKFSSCIETSSMDNAASLKTQIRFAWLTRAFALDARSLALYRIAIGAIVMIDALLRTRDFSLMFAPDGMFPIAALRQSQGDWTIWSLAYLVDSLECSAVVLVLEGVSGFFLMLGLFTPLVTVLAWASVVSVLRRTMPATNSGDLWLAVQLFWSIFLPLGARWSLDSRRRLFNTTAPPSPRVCSVASGMLVLQLAAIYFSAGCAKLNSDWMGGIALTHILSQHDHGTWLGEWLVGFPGVPKAITWLTIAVELTGPLVLIMVSHWRARLFLIATFILFHIAISQFLTVGLFGPIGIVAWLPILPAICWDQLGFVRTAKQLKSFSSTTLAPWFQILVLTFGIVAGIHLVHQVTGMKTPLPKPLWSILNLTCLSQNWRMFADVPQQHQWAYALGELSDGRLVDLLRNGRSLETIRPQGGFTSLPHHRWHKIFWELHRKQMRVFAPSIASALAHDWNATHSGEERVCRVEIRYAREGVMLGDDMVHELLLATWPRRGDAGAGNLERLLEELPDLEDKDPLTP